MKTNKYGQPCYDHRDVYKYFKARNPESQVTASEFLSILDEFNIRTFRERLLEGETVKPGRGIGEFEIRRIPRSPQRKTIDWGTTNKLRKEGIKTRVFFTDPWYFRIAWVKKSSNVTNKTIYSFRASGTNTRILAKVLRNEDGSRNELNELKFPISDLRGKAEEK